MNEGNFLKFVEIYPVFIDTVFFEEQLREVEHRGRAAHVGFPVGHIVEVTFHGFGDKAGFAQPAAFLGGVDAFVDRGYMLEILEVFAYLFVVLGEIYILRSSAAVEAYDFSLRFLFAQIGQDGPDGGASGAAGDTDERIVGFLAQEEFTVGAGEKDRITRLEFVEHVGSAQPAGNEPHHQFHNVPAVGARSDGVGAFLARTRNTELDELTGLERDLVRLLDPETEHPGVMGQRRDLLDRCPEFLDKKILLGNEDLGVLFDLDLAEETGVVHRLFSIHEGTFGRQERPDISDNPPLAETAGRFSPAGGRDENPVGGEVAEYRRAAANGEFLFSVDDEPAFAVVG